MGPRQIADEVLEAIVDALRRVSAEFDRWGEPYVRGPGLYFLIVDGTATDYSDPMGNNRWPVERCATVTDDLDRFVDTAKSVGTTCDGAVVVHSDGRIQPQMVRLHDLRGDTGEHDGPGVTYEDWMGTRHMSAVEASVRPNVVATATLSEEDGRVSVFVDGAIRTTG